MEDSKPVDISKAMSDDFSMARGRAIQEYANVEQSVCSLFSCLGDIETDVARIIFFNITNSNSVEMILDALITRKHGVTYAEFWKSLSGYLCRLNTTRNRVVHWNAMEYIDVSNGDREIGLIQPRDRNEGPDSIRMTKSELVDFTGRCDFIGRLCRMFSMFLDPKAPDELQQTWRDIFQQRITYPPLAPHPLSQKI